MAVELILMLINETHTSVWESIKRKRPHEVRLMRFDIAEMMTVFCYNLDGVRIELICRFWYQRDF